jgi:hypothetical protein
MIDEISVLIAGGGLVGSSMAMFPAECGICSRAVERSGAARRCRVPGIFIRLPRSSARSARFCSKRNRHADLRSGCPRPL